MGIVTDKIPIPYMLLNGEQIIDRKFISEGFITSVPLGNQWQ